MPRGIRTKYKGAQAQRPGSRRKTQWGTTLNRFSKPERTFAVSIPQFERMEHPRPVIVETGLSHPRSLSEFKVAEVEQPIIMKDRRKARAKPERRVGKEERRERQAGMVYGSESSRAVSVRENEFEELKEPKPTHLLPLPIIGEKGFFERRGGKHRRKTDQKQ